jgi:hypothetical protein
MDLNTSEESAFNRCGLVLTGANGGVLDEVRLGELDAGDRMPIALLGVATDVEGSPAVAVRCTLAISEKLELEDIKLAALEIGSSVIGPT